MNVQEMMAQAKDTMTVKRVFGESYEKDGVTVIPAAAIAGGAGGGEGGKSGEQGSGGFGMGAKPAGAYVIENGTVRWQPAVDVNRAILGGQIVAIVLLLTLRAIMTARARAMARA